MACRAVDDHVSERVRGFLRRRKKVSSRGARQFSGQLVFGKLGVAGLRQDTPGTASRDSLREQAGPRAGCGKSASPLR